MKGLYIHIPFCRQACRYCDFFFSVSLRYIPAFMDRLVEEIIEKSSEDQIEPVTTIYLGGGTPSVLSGADLDRLINIIYKHYSIDEHAEISIECNPDDLTRPFLNQVTQAGFNRVSIGIQSFLEKDLKLMNRSHDVQQAIDSVTETSAAGIKNITIDLIYGIPDQSHDEWESNLEMTFSLPVSHLSAYHLTFEKGTVFDHWRRRGRIEPVPEDLSVSLFRLLREKAQSKGFEHYEISNFALPGKMSAHNLTYWNGASYLGFGPSAHSYDGIRRIWNVSSLKKYLENKDQIEGLSVAEELNKNEQYHDYILTSLRTKWGSDPDYILEQFGEKTYHYFNKKATRYTKEGIMWKEKGRFAIKPQNWLIADHIMRNLFLD